MANLINFESLSMAAAAVVPIILALVQAFKMIGLPSKYSPIASIGLGVIVSFLFRSELDTMAHTILAGVIYGLSASGLYSGVKATTRNEVESEPKK